MSSSVWRKLDERVLSFRLTEDGELEDTEIGSRFDPLTGEATTGPLRGKKLSARLDVPGLVRVEALPARYDGSRGVNPRVGLRIIPAAR
jgi:hypothetical protein